MKFVQPIARDDLLQALLVCGEIISVSPFDSILITFSHFEQKVALPILIPRTLPFVLVNGMRRFGISGTGNRAREGE